MLNMSFSTGRELHFGYHVTYTIQQYILKQFAMNHLKQQLYCRLSWNNLSDAESGQALGDGITRMTSLRKLA